jgi:hypothetical protein
MHKIIPGILFLLQIFLLQSCASTSVKQQKANVTSSPAGALVYANGLEIGKTPLKRNFFDDFPAGWKGGVYSAQGVLMMKMAGCKDFALKVNDRILSEPIHAELECSNIRTNNTSTDVSATEKSTSAAAPPADTEARLKKLEALQQKGLITKEEYQKTRERILNEI